MKYVIALCATILCAPAAAAGITYDCDTAANHFSELVLPAPGGSFTVSGNVQLLTIAEVSKYAPIARVQVTSPSQPGQPAANVVGVSLAVLPAGAEETRAGAPALQMVSFQASGHKDEALAQSMLIKPGTPQSFRLRFDGANVAATIGSETRFYPMKAADPVVRLICSTGEFLFTNVTLQPIK
ncbi:hypothetical protein [Sphingomonas flavescens]|uniref:hypothetical protein n=1 Tax=Sphingomonas flavescens TaxID=3132797 RepID=UPI0028057FB6|nr:hypothetical protein [Sphingomonas limnosediminicola]